MSNIQVQETIEDALRSLPSETEDMDTSSSQVKHQASENPDETGNTLNNQESKRNGVQTKEAAIIPVDNLLCQMADEILNENS